MEPPGADAVTLAERALLEAHGRKESVMAVCRVPAPAGNPFDPNEFSMGSSLQVSSK